MLTTSDKLPAQAPSVPVMSPLPSQDQHEKLALQAAHPELQLSCLDWLWDFINWYIGTSDLVQPQTA